MATEFRSGDALFTFDGDLTIVGWNRAAEQMYPEAVRELQLAMKLWSAPPAQLEDLGRAYQQSGVSGFRNWKLAEAKRRKAPYDLAMAYAGVGDTEQAMKWLEASYQQHDWEMVQLPMFRVWDPVRSDPRFQELLHRLKFP